MKHLFLLAHQDDELFAQLLIQEAIQKSEEVQICFLTTGSGELQKVRNLESLTVLKQWGIPESNLYFLGSELQVADGALLHDLIRVRDSIVGRYEEFLRSGGKIWSPDWEGGHHDHDSAFLLASHLVSKYSSSSHGSFPLYRAMSGMYPFFYTMSLLNPKLGGIPKLVSWKQKYEILKTSKFYPSQRKTWLGLLPMMVFHFLFHRVLYTRDGKAINSKTRPHEGPLFYERRFSVSYQKVAEAGRSLESLI